jgi:protease II
VRKLGSIDEDAWWLAYYEHYKHAKSMEEECSLSFEYWTQKILDKNWQPLKLEYVEEGVLERSLCEDDKLLVTMHEAMGEELYKLVVNALMEIGVHSDGSRFVQSVPWDSEFEEKADPVDVINEIREWFQVINDRPRKFNNRCLRSKESYVSNNR